MMLFHRKVTSQHFSRLPRQYAGTHLYSPECKEGTARVECFAQEHKKLSQSGLELLWKLAPLVQYGQFRFVSLLKRCTLVKLFVEIERGQELIPKKGEKVAGICITDFDYNLNEIYFLHLPLVENLHMTCR